MRRAAAAAGKSETLDRYAADYPMGPHDQPQSMCPAFGSLRVGLRMRRTATVLSGSACCVYGLTFTSHFYGARRTVGYVPFNSETLVTGKLFEDIRESVFELADPDSYDAIVVINLCVPTASGVPLRLLPPSVNGVRIIGIDVPGFEAMVYPVKDYRFVLRLRGGGLSEQVTEMDPGRLGVPPLPVHATAPEGERTAAALNHFVAQAQAVLREEQPANMALLRGVSGLPDLPAMGSAYGLNPAAIAAYPMYRGLAHTLGMHVIEAGATFAEEVQALHRHYSEHDFFYVHYKPADAAGEDGDFDAKVRTLEELDTFIPSLLELDPDVLIVAGDHATPAIMANHTWHPVPFLLRSQWTLGEGVEAFSERAFATGSLGTIPANQAMLLALAHAGKLTKFGP